MANKTIPVKDKQLVVQRMAEGASTRQAIQGTRISSNQTAARIARSQSHVIAQRREEYVEQINHYARHGQKGRACMLADMAWANKYIKKRSIKAQYSDGTAIYEDTMEKIPDWDMRLKAIKYIDYLAGMNPGGGVQLNVLQQVSNQLV